MGDSHERANSEEKEATSGAEDAWWTREKGEDEGFGSRSESE